jgi:sulfur-oxidizing protein SoxX
MKKHDTALISTKSLIGALTLLCGLLIAACTPKENSPVGFILPPGDAMTGQTTFAALGCISCHKVDGVSFTASDMIKPDLVVTLGGQQLRVKTYGQLVTAIIHPNAAIFSSDERYVDAEGQSLMPDYTQMMTVQQMTDLVTFLQEHYEITPPTYDPQGLGYPYY